jgi:hypothetical protein
MKGSIVTDRLKNRSGPKSDFLISLAEAELHNGHAKACKGAENDRSRIINFINKRACLYRYAGGQLCMAYYFKQRLNVNRFYQVVIKARFF